MRRMNQVGQACAACRAKEYEIWRGLRHDPATQEANRSPTVAGKGRFPFFRFHGPMEGYFDKSWQLPDIEKVK